MNHEYTALCQKWLKSALETVDETLASGPPYDFSGPLAMSVSMIEGAPDLGIQLLKKMAETGHEKSLLFLGEIYADGKIHLRDGILASKNPELANEYLNKAVELGSTSAMLKLMGEHYIDDGVLKYRDPEKALYWLKRAAEAGCQTACESWADHLVDGQNAQGCTQEEIDEIERYYNSARRSEAVCYKMARFHSDGITSTDYSGPEYRNARIWLNSGTSHAGYLDKDSPCQKLKDEWGVGGKPSGDASSNGMFILQLIAGGVGLVVFAALGTAAAAAAGAIMSVTLPVLIVGFILYGIFKMFFSKD